ncbi:tRNA-dihydrouridine synthase [candidate division WOR-3 bacterium]|nr:tRNA-dihydrouridine synthase [candidate division WOR-3 bacterium]
MRIELAPLDGITDFPFRCICKKCGASHLTTEMIPVQGILSNPERYLKKAHFTEAERPITVQIVGSDPVKIRKAVSSVNGLEPDFIELNAGCPARKIIKSENGAALLKDLSRLKICAEAVLEESKKPVTIKIRTGFDRENLLEIICSLETMGVEAIKIHGRTASQNYAVKADWDLLISAAKKTKTPVVGNGDIDSYEKAVSLLSHKVFLGVMIGRASRGNPWIFSGKIPSCEEKKEIIGQHCRMAVEFYGEIHGMRIMRKHLLWYLKGVKNSKDLKISASIINSLSESYKIIGKIDCSDNPWVEAQN